MNPIITFSYSFWRHSGVIATVSICIDTYQKKFPLFHSQIFVIDSDYKGCKRITLLTDKMNIRAQKFYKQHKFNRSSMIPFRMIINNR